MAARDEGRRPPLAFRSKAADAWLYGLWAGACTLVVACLFYASLRQQVHYSWLTFQPTSFPRAASGELLGEWSAPLDDVFIHFDFARATARGYPFQWSEGNGYSSGGTSLLYPFVLAFGYWIGFRQLHLVVWAGVVACVCVFAVLLGSRRLFAGLPTWTTYLAPPVFLAVGALDWTLFSGMEVALLLAVWTGGVLAWLRLVDPGVADPESVRSRVGSATLLGLWGAAIVSTRPEGAVLVAIFAASAAASVLGRRGRSAAMRVLLAAALPGALVVVAQAIANRVLTGDASAAGAMAKLEMHHPHMSWEQVWDAWAFHVRYQILRVTHYHLSEVPGWGWIVWAIAAVPLLERSTRRVALLLWASAIGWILLVALNGQVRWQNERYTMPSVAWLLLSAAMGLGILVGRGYARGRRGWFARAASVGVAVAASGVFAWQQLPRFREQVWFFGRASRNIRDQHVLTGRLLRHHDPTPRRVLVGDAGAIPYAADLPALDIIGLGGYRGLPFARATRWGVEAAIELIERMPAGERPDVLAIYPSWWGAFPLWFGEPIAKVPVLGNVICGGTTKVVYRPDWTPLDGSHAPFELPAGWTVVDEVDFGDVVSEGRHGYRLSRPAVGFLTMKLLPHPKQPDRDVWDAGRITPPDVREDLSLDGLAPSSPTKLVFRTAPSAWSELVVSIGGKEAVTIDMPPYDGWKEVTVDVPDGQVVSPMPVTLSARSGERVLYHLWALQPE